MFHPVFVILLALGAQTDDQEILFPGTGSYTRSVVTHSEKAQQFFNQGLNFLYAFNHGEAKRSFRTAVKYDPECAMAWWGLAMANGPHINNMTVMPEEEKEAVEALKKALQYINGNPPVDQALIRATLVRFKYPPLNDRTPLNQAFANEMRKVWKRFPNDDDVGALFAESLMDLRPWDLWKPNGTPQPGTKEIISTLGRVIKLDPNNPMGLHLYIHALEASPNPRDAKEAADRLRDLQPGLGHNVHMPSHIDVLLGDWEKAIIANEKAIAADKAYREKRPNQFIYRIYMAHNQHMLAFAAMMVGQSEKAINAVDTMIAEIPEDFQNAAAPFIDGFFAMPFEVRVRFGMWDEVLAYPDLPERFPLSRTLRHAARSVSYAAKGMTQEARSEQALFYMTRKLVPKDAIFGNNSANDILRVAHHLMNGEILVAENDLNRAIAELRLATKAEDALRYDEPPGWIQPTRHTLGAVLLKANRYEEAVRVYRQDLRRHPNNGWSLFGMAEALKNLGRQHEASMFNNAFDRVWKNADVTIMSSCMCITKK
ncbi:MAG TPA: hypothetical protein VNK96_07960 [Fimbriimonadales bacterium]|nr:hypothetical protein [Fimbriimonadales bacterium]